MSQPHYSTTRPNRPVSLPLGRYSIEKSSDPDKFFYIEITSGVLMTLRPLDREEVGWHNFTVLAMEMSTSTAVVVLLGGGGATL